MKQFFYYCSRTTYLSSSFIPAPCRNVSIAKPASNFWAARARLAVECHRMMFFPALASKKQRIQVTLSGTKSGWFWLLRLSSKNRTSVQSIMGLDPPFQVSLRLFPFFGSPFLSSSTLSFFGASKDSFFSVASYFLCNNFCTCSCRIFSR